MANHLSPLPSFPILSTHHHTPLPQVPAILNTAQNVLCIPTPPGNCTCCAILQDLAPPGSLPWVPPCSRSPPLHVDKAPHLRSPMEPSTHLIVSAVVSWWVYLLVCELLIHRCIPRAMHSAQQVVSAQSCLLNGDNDQLLCQALPGHRIYRDD